MRGQQTQQSVTLGSNTVAKLILEILAIIVLAKVPILYFLPYFASNLSWIMQAWIDVLVMSAIAAPLIVWRFWRSIEAEQLKSQTNSRLYDQLDDATNSRVTCLLSSALVIGFICLGVLIHQTIDRIKINGPMYAEIIEQKDLVADILPPPAYAVESYLTMFELASPYRNAEQKFLEAKLRIGG